MGEVVVEFRSKLSVVNSSVVKPVGVVVVDGEKPSVVNCVEDSVEVVVSGSLMAAEVVAVGL